MGASRELGVRDTISHGSELVSEEFKKRVKNQYQIDYDKHNWSWLLHPKRLAAPPVVPRDKPSVEDAAELAFNVARGEANEDEVPPRREKAASSCSCS